MWFLQILVSKDLSQCRILLHSFLRTVLIRKTPNTTISGNFYRYLLNLFDGLFNYTTKMHNFHGIAAKNSSLSLYVLWHYFESVSQNAMPMQKLGFQIKIDKRISILISQKSIQYIRPILNQAVSFLKKERRFSLQFILKFCCRTLA